MTWTLYEDFKNHQAFIYEVGEFLLIIKILDSRFDVNDKIEELDSRFRGNDKLDRNDKLDSCFCGNDIENWKDKMDSRFHGNDKIITWE